jgi:hypothetical protein
MFVEDLSSFFEVAEHAVQAELDSLPVVGIFDRPHGEAFDGIATSSPRFTLPSASAEGVTLQSLLRIGDERFQVRSVEPDGTGVTVLTLEAAL